MAVSGKMNTAQACTKIAEPVAEELGLMLWDVRFEKEGSGWYLRFFIDKDGGVNIEDCENFSRKIDKVLDDADPIEQSYILEVSSPGIERNLIKPCTFCAIYRQPDLHSVYSPGGWDKRISGDPSPAGWGLCGNFHRHGRAAAHQALGYSLYTAG